MVVWVFVGIDFCFDFVSFMVLMLVIYGIVDKIVLIDCIVCDVVCKVL